MGNTSAQNPCGREAALPEPVLWLIPAGGRGNLRRQLVWRRPLDRRTSHSTRIQQLRPRLCGWPEPDRGRAGQNGRPLIRWLVVGSRYSGTPQQPSRTAPVPRIVKRLLRCPAVPAPHQANALLIGDARFGQHDRIATLGQPQRLGQRPHRAGLDTRAAQLFAGRAVVACRPVVDEDFPARGGDLTITPVSGRNCFAPAWICSGRVFPHTSINCSTLGPPDWLLDRQ